MDIANLSLEEINDEQQKEKVMMPQVTLIIWKHWQRFVEMKLRTQNKINTFRLHQLESISLLDKCNYIYYYTYSANISNLIAKNRFFFPPHPSQKVEPNTDIHSKSSYNRILHSNVVISSFNGYFPLSYPTVLFSLPPWAEALYGPSPSSTNGAGIRLCTDESDEVDFLKALLRLFQSNDIQSTV